jgi:predicted MPP superfamily phosphohydrolase
VAPLFAVKGNWDAWYWWRLDLFGGTGVQELDRRAVEVDVRGVPVWLAGVAVQKERHIPRTLAMVPPGALTIFAYHYPDQVAAAVRRGVDLYLAGHTHGGQVALPFYGALTTSSKLGKTYEAGLYRAGRTWLYVNRGLGMDGGLPRVRFCARPEVTVIEIAAPSAGRPVAPPG